MNSSIIFIKDLQNFLEIFLKTKFMTAFAVELKETGQNLIFLFYLYFLTKFSQ